MISITGIFKLIPDSLKQTAVDAIVETVVERGEGLLSESILGKIKGLRSDAAFRQQLDAGLQRGLQRFVNEYQLQDEDLVAAIVADDALFAQPDVQQTLLTILQQPGRYLAEEHAALNQSFASVLPQRLNRDRVDRAVAFLLKCLARELWHLPELQPIYSLEFQRITAESTREQLAVQKAQLAALENLNVGVRDALLQLTDALGEQKQLAAGQSSTRPETPLPAVYHNLPQPDYGEFVGREQEIKQIFELLRPYPQSRHHLIVIDGIGGIGKSTLALEVAHRCLHASQQAARAEQPEQDHLVRLRQILIDRFSEDELRTLCFDMALDYDMLPGQGKGGKARELIVYLDRRDRLDELIETVKRLRPDANDMDWRAIVPPHEGVVELFDAIVWISAKRTILTDEGISERYQAANTLHDIYRTLSITLEREGILRMSSHEQAEVIRRLLTKQRTLLVIDNLETIDDETVTSFLQELPAPSKAIVTTRHRINISYPVRLLGMPWEDARNFIMQESIKNRVKLTDDESSSLYQKTGGMPLAIVWSIAQIGFGDSIDSILRRLGQSTNDIIQYCFSTALLNIQDSVAYRLLTALSTFEVDATREALGFVIDVPPLDRDEGLVKLEKLSLVNRSADRFSLLPLTKAFALSELSNPDIYIYRQRSLLWFSQWMETGGKIDWPLLKRIEGEQDNILALIAWGFAKGPFEETALCLRWVNNYMWSRGYWNEHLDYLQAGLDAAQQNNSVLYLGIFSLDMGNLLRFQGRFEQAFGYVQNAIKYLEKANEESKAVDAMRNLGMLFLAQNKLVEARKLMHSSLTRLKHIEASHSDPDGFKAHLYNNLAELEYRDQNLEKATFYIEQAQTIADKREDLAVTQVVIHRLQGKLAYQNNQFKQAEFHFRESLLLSKELNLQQDKAYATYHLARAIFAQEKYESSLQLAKEALNLFQRLGMHGHTAKTKELIRTLEENYT